MSYSKESVKEFLEIEDMFNLLEYFGAEPQMYSNYLVAKTICHNGDTHKLYWYENTQLFRCYTGSCGSFDVFELVQKIQEIEDLNKAIYFVVNFFNLQGRLDESDEDFSIEDYKIFNRYDKIEELSLNNNDRVRLPQIPDYIQYYPQPHLANWEKEGITKEVCDYMGIRYNPVNGSILIPHYDENERLIGIRQRTLVQEDEKYGKYRPARVWADVTNPKGILCNHPLAFSLYGLNKAKNNIRNIRKVIVVESEKSVLKYMSYFGQKSNICVAVCGSSISKYQFQLLLDLNIQEVIIGFDKDFKELRTNESHEVVQKLKKIRSKYGNQVNISFLFDRENNLLGYKDSPLDCGKDVFLELFKTRVIVDNI